MIRHLYLLILLSLAATGLRAQCTSEAGTIDINNPMFCEGLNFQVVSMGNAVLDADDVFGFVVFTGSSPQTGTILDYSTDGMFLYNPVYLNSPVWVSAVVGNNDGAGFVDFTDPCLSVSPAANVEYKTYPQVTATGGTITCNEPEVVLTASADQPGVTFTWSGPSGFVSTSQNVSTLFPGEYCVIVTNNSGCTGATCALVVADVNPPGVTVPPTTPLDCISGTAIINANIFNCTFCDLFWVGPGVINGQGTESIMVNQLGSYQVIATNVENGCTISTFTQVVPQNPIPQGNFTVTNASCFNISDGAVILSTLPPGVPPYTFSWTGPAGYVSNQQNLSGVQSGTYQLTATDLTGCDYVGTVQIGSPPAISLPSGQQTITNPFCNGDATGSINITVLGGTQPLTYAWSGPNGFASTQEDLIGLVSGTYTVTVSDVFGCSLVSTPFAPTHPAPLVVDISVVNCGDNTLFAEVSGGVVPYTFNWIDGNTTAVVTDLLPGNYTVTVTDANGCTAIGEYNFTGSTSNLCGYILGRLVLDSTMNCESNVPEPGLAGWIVKAVDGNDTYYGVSNDSGYYKIAVDEGSYILQVDAPNDQLWLVCTPIVAVGQVSPDDTVSVPDVPVQEILNCPLMEVSISTPFLRRCFDNNFYYVNYCNVGTDDALNASIVVTMDPFLSIVTSELLYANLGNGQYLFELGNVAVGACGDFWFRVMVSCDAVLGQTHCVEALADPAGECLITDPLWSGASVSLRSECTTDSVYFIIKNTGIGNMSADAEYIVIEDAVMRAMGTDLRLDSGDSMRIAVPANGATWRVEVTQEPLHPGASQPMLSVEGCSATGVFTTGFVSQFSSDDDDPWIDIECRANIGAYDPNDKQGFPIGYGAQRYIKPGTDIEYLIRFQNTGTDTAFNVYVLDTLSSWLDPASIRLGASSHPFVFDIYGNGILKFDFPNIMLPDSNVNEPLSHGFVQFRIAHRENAPLETVIENEAAIYFDFNEPIFTNTTEHRLGENFLSVSSWEVLRPGLKLDVAPNPSVDVARVTVNGLKGGEDLRLRICDLQGRVVRELVGTGGVFEIQRGAMPAGVYMLVLFVDGQAAGNGKMVVK
ncbi:MAG: hypothetical protein IT270_01575 [Saprospiraceae bacterium]|nr:hypothetical protein [Saprospiraceae bacterium]